MGNGNENGPRGMMLLQIRHGRAAASLTADGRAVAAAACTECTPSDATMPLVAAIVCAAAVPVHAGFAVRAAVDSLCAGGYGGRRLSDKAGQGRGCAPGDTDIRQVG